MPIKRAFAAATAVDDQNLVVVGGLDSNGNYLSSVERYNGITQEWETLPDMPHALYGGAAVSTNGKVYVVGGRTDPKHTTSALEVLDMKNTSLRKWKGEEEKLAPMKHSRRGCAAVLVEGFIYVFGGYQYNGEEGGEYLNYAERYEIKTNQWEDLAPMDTPRAWCAAATVGGKIYVIGGQCDSESIVSPKKTGQVFDIKTLTWSRMPRMGTRRFGCGAAALSRFVVVIGGKNEHGEYVQNAEVYDTKERTWEMPEHATHNARYGFAVAVLGRKQVVVVGGTEEKAGPAEVVLEKYCEELLPATTIGDKRPQSLFGDHAKGEDLLGVESEARALADTIAFKNLSPPFAVGLLGGWGSGKSFTFNLILNRWKEIQEMNLTRRADKEIFPFVGHLYVIKFDAWTFAKGNLWSSLMYRILTGLNDQLHFESLLRDHDDEILLKGVSTLQIMEELSRDEFKYLKEIIKDESVRENFTPRNGEISRALVDAVYETYKDDREDLEKKKVELDRKEKLMKNERAWHRISEKAGKKLQGLLQEAHDHYKAKHDIEDPVTIQDVLDDLNAWQKLWMEMRSAKFTPFGWAILFGAIIVGTVVTIVVFLGAAELYAGFISGIASVVTVVVSLVSYVTRYFNKLIKPLKEAFEEAQREELDLEAGDPNENKEIINLNEEIIQLKSDIKSIQQRVWLVEGESVDALVRERIEEADYEKELGVVHKAQSDLQRLSDALRNKRSEKVFPRGDPRIVLFVDDLDRCPPKKVVEMLEAVQLLVKTDLFVVVMAIDARFVTLSLEKEYSAILRRGEDPSGLDYLEKIIQLPYRIPPINREQAMESFLRGQMKFEEQPKRATIEQDNQETKRQAALISDNKKSHEGDARQARNDKPNKLSDDSIVTDSVQRPAPQEQYRKEAKDPQPIVRQPLKPIPSEELEFTEDELRMLKSACLAANVSPRSAKRIVNVYKVMKIIWHNREKQGQVTSQLERNACLLLLSMCGSRTKSMRVGMCEAFEKAERKKFDMDDLGAFFIQVLDDRIVEACTGLVLDILSKVEWNHFEKDFWLARSFSFIGEYLEPAGSHSDFNQSFTQLPENYVDQNSMSLSRLPNLQESSTSFSQIPVFKNQSFSSRRKSSLVSQETDYQSCL